MICLDVKTFKLCNTTSTKPRNWASGLGKVEASNAGLSFRQGEIANDGCWSTTIEEVRKNRPNPLRAFRHNNFRLFWFGQLISLIGSWMQGLAGGWLILVLADPGLRAAVFSHGGDASAVAGAQPSATAEQAANFYSGLVNFASGLPVLILTLFAGVLVDKVNKRRLLLATQTIAMGCAAVLGFLVHTGRVSIAEVIVISGVLGLTMALDMPARQSFVVELVGREDLPSAVALNSSMFNSARAIGPAVAGYLLAAHVSLAACYFLNAASYLAVLLGMALMRGNGLGAPRIVPEAEKVNFLENLKQGIRYVRNDHTALNLTLLVGGFGLFAFSFNVLIPTFVKYTLLRGFPEAAQIKAFGTLETVRGCGALLGAITVAVLSRPRRQKTMLITGSLLASSLLIVFSLAHSIMVAYITMAIVSYGFVLCFATSNTLMQMSAPDELRGRVMSIYLLMFIGTGPLGSLLAGDLAQRFKAPHTILFFALLSLGICLFLSFRPGGLMHLKAAQATTSAESTPARPSPPLPTREA